MVELAVDFMATLAFYRSYSNENSTDNRYFVVINIIWFFINSSNVVIWWLAVFRVKTVAIYMDKNYKSEQQIED